MGFSIKLPTKGENKPKTKINPKKLASKICLVSFLIGFVFACCSIYYTVFDINRNKNAIKTDATVKKVQFVNENYLLDITYEVDNKDYDNTIMYDGDSITINDKVSIKYNSKNPLDIITTNHAKEIIIFTPLAIIFITGSVIYTLNQKRKANRIAKLKQNGNLIYADIEGIFVNNAAKKRKGKLPYHIKAIYTNPETQTTLTYLSQDYYEDLLMLTSSKTITKVPVYINKKNASDYYMDLVYILPEDDNE